MRKLTLTTEDKYFQQDGLSSSRSPGSYFLSLSTWSALDPLSELFCLLPFVSFFPVCHLSFSPIFLPLLLSVVLPSHHPPDCFSYPPSHSLHPLFVFSQGPFSLHLDSLPFTHPSHSPYFLFLPSLLLLLRTRHLWSDLRGK